MFHSLSADIIQLTGNTGGKDYVIGDVHGNSEVLEKVLALLTEKDRLFIVGDLVDRGPDNPEVIHKIHAANEDHKKVFVVRGNHENMFIDTLEKMIKITEAAFPPPKDLKETSAIRTTLLSDPIINNHIKNGGQWIVDKFCKELEEGILKYKYNHIAHHADSELFYIYNYFRSLPYIIHVNRTESGTPPFNVVHADLPFNDKMLKERFEKNPKLSAEEKAYATWARLHMADKNLRLRINGRDAESDLSYCGHNIAIKQDVLPIRLETNTLVIDVGTFATDVSLVINHTDRQAIYVGDIQKNPTYYEPLLETQEDIQAHLDRTGLKAELKPTNG